MFKFQATLDAPKIKKPTADQYGYNGEKGELKGGGVTLAFAIKRPEAPRPPYDIQTDADLEAFDKATEEMDADKPPKVQTWGEDAKAVAARQKRADAEFKRDIKNRPKEREKLIKKIEADAKKMERHEAELVKTRELLIAYGELIALASVFGGIECDITIKPTGDGLLPGTLDLMQTMTPRLTG